MAFCQTVEKLALNTKCYGIDTWLGDPTQGLYGGEVYEELKSYHDPVYGKFSKLMKCPFDEALNGFKDGSVDLLHIDGFHAYEAVKHDYETWLPKMSSRGVILFHDTNVYDMNFGVWKLWEEINGLYPSFEFKHGYGLGVLAVGPESFPRMEPLIRSMKDSSLEKFFHFAGRQIVLDRQLSEKKQQQAVFEKQSAEKDRQIIEKDNQIVLLGQQLNEKSLHLFVAYNSYSWKMTAPLRWFHKQYMKLIRIAGLIGFWIRDRKWKGSLKKLSKFD